MKFLRNYLDSIEPHFHKGGKLEKWAPLHETLDTFIYTPGNVNSGRTHVRDGADLKRVMMVVVIALIPALLMALYNTGFQANTLLANMHSAGAQNWRQASLLAMGFQFDPGSCGANFMHGLLYFLPVFAVCFATGGFWEVLFGLIRGHEVNEGFLVTGFLIPLTLPPTIPLWQVAVGTSFGVVVAKEIFGGTGRNFMNPALAARAFLFFAYPGQISGDAVWIAVDGATAATPLGIAATQGLAAIKYTWMEAFNGFIPGSMGETSTFAILIGAAILIITGIGSWRIMLSITISMFFFTFLLNTVGSTTNVMFAIPGYWHLVLGGFAFGTVFMATDPVSSAMTNMGRYIYGGLIGLMVVLVRVVNPAFPEGIMLAILFGNVFAPLIDYYVVKSNIKRRKLRDVC